jgi:predicted lipid-binding transport protein (Tim44 family)
MAVTRQRSVDTQKLLHPPGEPAASPPTSEPAAKPPVRNSFFGRIVKPLSAVLIIGLLAGLGLLLM